MEAPEEKVEEQPWQPDDEPDGDARQETRARGDGTLEIEAAWTAACGSPVHPMKSANTPV